MFGTRTWWHVFSFSILWCDQCWVSVWWLMLGCMWTRRLVEKIEIEEVPWTCQCGAPLWYPSRIFVWCVNWNSYAFVCHSIYFKSQRNMFAAPSWSFLLQSWAQFYSLYIRIIKNLSLSPRRMLISHWSLESIWTPKTSKPCLKPEDKHVSLGVFASVNEWWQKVSL